MESNRCINRYFVGVDGTNVLASTDNASVCMSHDDDMTSVTEEEANDKLAVSSVCDLATSLLSEWANLKVSRVNCLFYSLTELDVRLLLNKLGLSCIEQFEFCVNCHL